MNSFNSMHHNLAAKKYQQLVVSVSGSAISPIISGNTYTFYIYQNSNFTINKSININYTIVSGGGGVGAAVSARSGPGGGGGHVLNCYGYPYTAGTTLYATIGVGGTGINSGAQSNLYQTGSPGMDTKITTTSPNGSILNSTNFTSYGGGGGGSVSGSNFIAQLGSGSNGGFYVNNTGTYAPGGGGGGLTTIINGITAQYRGYTGGNATSTSAGSGGTGQLGIDGVYYGGGGGGGFNLANGTNTEGIGGIGGGQNGSYSSFNKTAITGAYHIIGTTYITTRTGNTPGEQGGGGGGCYVDGITYLSGSLTRIPVPSPGIAVIQFNWP